MGSNERPTDLSKVVDALCAANAETLGEQRTGAAGLPSREALHVMMQELRAALFPGHYAPTDVSVETAHYHVGALLDAALRTLEEQVRRALVFSSPVGGISPERPLATVRAFAARLPAVRALLASDVRAAFEGDPAARSADEAILCYPGVTAVLYQRIAHELHVLGVPLIPRIVTEEAHAATGIDIHPGARIGASFFIDHGTGVVIGETAVIGERVRLFQGVTLGAKSFPLDAEGRPVKGMERHPIVEDDVVIYAGATILGRVTIGRGSSIGGNVWLTRSVPPGSRITQGKSQADGAE